MTEDEEDHDLLAVLVDETEPSARRFYPIDNVPFETAARGMPARTVAIARQVLRNGVDVRRGGYATADQYAAQRGTDPSLTGPSGQVAKIVGLVLGVPKQRVALPHRTVNAWPGFIWDAVHAALPPTWSWRG